MSDTPIYDDCIRRELFRRRWEETANWKPIILPADDNPWDYVSFLDWALPIFSVLLSVFAVIYAVIA